MAGLRHVSRSGDRQRARRRPSTRQPRRTTRLGRTIPLLSSNRLLAVADLRPERHSLLEIGCATGKATLPLAQRGMRITRLEPGPALAGVARLTLAAYDVEIVTTRFEDWDAGGQRFDLVFAATSWHWIDPAVRYQRAAAVLEPTGHLAFWVRCTSSPTTGTRSSRRSRRSTTRSASRSRSVRPCRGRRELPDQRADIEGSGLFEVVDVRQFDWETVYGADGYLALLDTFSGTHRHAGLAARASVRRDPPPSR